MNHSILYVLSLILVGMGATLTFDIWGFFLKYVFKITPSNFCLVGRWILYMPKGIFRHPNIGSAARRGGECTVGWIAHYLTGAVFAFTFVAVAGNDWLRHPTLMPAILFGVFTILAPFFIMQPLLGLGIAASKAPNPLQARLRSLMNHTIFGIGLYLFGLVVNRLLSIYA